MSDRAREQADVVRAWEDAIEACRLDLNNGKNARPDTAREILLGKRRLLDALVARVDELGNELAQERAKPGGTFDQWHRLQVTEARVASLEIALREIVACDYRGNEPVEHRIARWALGLRS